MRSRFVRALLVCAAVTGLLLHRADLLRAVSTNVVISQVYGAGGNSGAVLNSDYIELFNRGTSSVSLAGMSVQYASTAGTTWQATALPAVTLAPGQYFLVRESTGANGAALPAPDALGTIAMAAGAGKVALVSTTTLLTGSCPGGVVDLVGYGSGTNCFEGSGPTGTINTTTAALRGGSGCTDTDNNSADFATGAPAPRNSSSAFSPCGGGDSAPSVTSTTPVNAAANVPLNASVVINFSESVTATGAFALECPAGSPRTFTQTASPAASFTLTPNSPLPPGTVCGVKVTATAVTDTDLNDPPDNMAADFVFSFTTAAPVVDAAPTVIGSTPANGTTGIAVSSNIVVTFSESVSASPTAFSVQCPAGTPQAFTQSASPATAFTLTMSSALPYSTTCTISIAANQISDTDADDPPDNMTADATFSFTTAAAPPPGAGKVIINEIDADTPGSDTAEFIELYDGGSGNTPLDGLVVVLYDGGLTPFTGNQSYAAFDLTGFTTDANGYFVLGNPGVPDAGIVFDPGQFGLLQNGPDAVALYIGHASDFPSGTVVTTTNLLDAIVYGTNDPAPANLMSLINPGQLIVNEDGNGLGTVESSQRCPNGMGGIRNSNAYRQAAPTPGGVNSCPVQSTSDVVISQVYGGGANSGATYHNDYVELYNLGAATVDLSGWSVQYASASGSGWSTNLQPLGGTIGSHEYLLIALGAGTGGGASLPPANITGQINMSGTSGKVALTDSFDPLTGNCPLANPHVKDFVGYGAADCGEGSTTAVSLNGNNALALFRLGAGATDTNNNHNDFATGTPNPRRTAPIVELGPFVLLTDPIRNSTAAPRDATIQVTFTEPVDLDPNWFDITCAATGPHNSATFAGTGKDHYITPNVNFQAGESCTVTVFKDAVHDQDLDDIGPNTDTLPANFVWSFTVATGTAPPFPPGIHLSMGNPSAAGSDPNNYLMEKPEYALSYNRDMGRPNWVSWHLSNDWTGTLTRVDTFRPDPQVPPDWYRVQAFDFSGSGFDRGHMTPNADRDKETSIPINQATFLMSNMVAQAPLNNQGPWADLEAYLRTLVEPPAPGDPVNEIYIVSGPAGIGGTGSNGGVTTTLANGHVTVPAWTWKVALVLPKADGDDLSRVSCSTRTIAVIMPNSQTINSDWTTYLTTVDAVETLTGYNFFSNLPEPLQACIEAGINGNNPPLVKGNQTITFDPLADRTYGDGSFTVSATGGASGNPVTFAASGNCTASGASISITGAGACTVTASQAGNDFYNPAGDVARSFTIAKAAAAFSGVSSPSIEAGTASAVVSGTIAAGGLIPAGTVTVTLGPQTLSVAIDPSGNFSATLATGSLGPAGSPYAIGLSYAGDTNFNAASTSSTLTVADTTPPSITLVGPATLTIEGGTAFTDPGATASDSFAGDLTSAIQATGTVNTAVVGSYTRTYTVSDGYNTASATRTVNVVDTIPPVLTLVGGADVTTALGSPWVDPGATAQDSRAGNLTAQITKTGVVNTAVIGAYQVTYSVSDGVNTSTAVRTVHVVDQTAPVISNLMATPNTLFFPTNTLWPVFVGYNATDASGTPACSLSVSSNDPDSNQGHGLGATDWFVLSPHLVLLRAERAPRNQPALVYTIAVTCRDASNNQSTAQVLVPVRQR